MVKGFRCSTVLLLYTADVATSVLLPCSLPAAHGKSKWSEWRMIMGTRLLQARETLKVAECFMQYMTTNPELVVCHFPTKINKTCPCSVHAFFTLPWTLQVTAWAREQSQLSAHALTGFQYTIVTDVNIFQTYLCAGAFEMFLTCGYPQITTTILCSCECLENEGNVPTESDVQTPAPALRYVKNLIDLLMHLCEQRWVGFCDHNFWTVVKAFCYT